MSNWKAVAHITLWAQLGVLLRIFLRKAFGGECGHWGWVACVTSDGVSRLGGALFQDLPANVLGCFIIGLVSSSAALGLSDGAAVAAFPRAAAWQGRAAALHVGLRTGFCGSLTTFASWMLQVARMLFGSGDASAPIQYDRVSALFAVLIGTQTAVASVAAGRHLAAWAAATGAPAPPCAAEGHGRPGGASGAPPGAARDATGRATDGLKPSAGIEDDSAQEAPSVRAELALSVVSHRHVPSARPAASNGDLFVACPLVDPGGAESRHDWDDDRTLAECGGDASAFASDSERARFAATTAAVCGGSAHGRAGMAEGSGATGGRLGVDAKGIFFGSDLAGGGEFARRGALGQSQRAESLPAQEVLQRADSEGGGAEAGAAAASDGACSALDVVTCALAAALLSTMVALSVVFFRRRRNAAGSVCLAAVLGVPGALLRWQLARLNSLPAAAGWTRLRWLPVGTFAANMLACGANFVVEALQLRTSPPAASAAAASALILGFMGALSTVSTWAVELADLSALRPHSLDALKYALASVVCAQLLGVALYGWAAWA